MRTFCLLLLVLIMLCLQADLSVSAEKTKRVVATSKATSQGEKRLALVIGNSAYKVDPLKNPVNDARLLAQSLSKAGFTLYGGKAHENLGYGDMMALLDGFGNQLAADGVGMVFYSGHGLQVRGENYLVPVDAVINSENEVPYRTVPAGLLLAKMGDAHTRVNIVVLDACRNNPFVKSFRSGGSGGLAAMSAPTGTIIAYSTDANRFAEDGSGTNSIYSKALATAILQPGMEIEKVFKQVRTEVRTKSGNKQEPREYSSLEGNFIFIQTSGPVIVQQAPVANHVADAEKEAWLTIKDSTNPADFKDFIEKFPSGVFTNTASIKFRQLVKKQRDQDPRTTYVTVEGSTFTITNIADGLWTETKNNQFFTSFSEITRNHEYIELYDKSRDLKIRLCRDAGRHFYKETEAWVGWPNSEGHWKNTKIDTAFTEPVTGMEFVPVKGGCFQMGDVFGDGQPNSKPVHKVCLDDFSMGKYQVTVDQFRIFVEETSYKTDAEANGNGCAEYKDNKWQLVSGTSWRNPGYKPSDRHPATCLSWNDAITFASWLTQKNGSIIYRLPTEAEWEYAARSGGKNEKWPGVAADSDNSEYVSPMNGSVNPVGLNRSNGLQLHDMVGSAKEWVYDWYDENYYKNSPEKNPTGPAKAVDEYISKVLRGYDTTTLRQYTTKYNKQKEIGFRLVARSKQP